MAPDIVAALPVASKENLRHSPLDIQWR